jgi:NADH-quinone oxidoreductase subunit G
LNTVAARSSARKRRRREGRLMSDDTVNIEVDGTAVKARKGQMIMQVTDPAGIYIPRFCYHEKLSVAANCRMCLVEVEKAPKPMPACATPVTEGMKVFTKSPKAIAAQKATMEFLLINHPLDCPICDQGGECELQDLAMGFGRDISRYAERKRVVKDKNLGPLVSTDMTRCIHCTRCVRFGQEIQGFPELGTTGRGEHMEITTYVEHSVDHELSANIIDLCPVGALNNKPFRYHARAWEMTQHELISPHDAVGSNLYAHVLQGKLMRMVPRPNEAINETWIADRDRFGFEGIYSADRVLKPLLRVDGELKVVDWETALTAAAQGLTAASKTDAARSLGFLASPSSTLEEFYLLSQLARGLGTDNIDHRLRQLDFRAQDQEAVLPGLGMALAEVDRLQGILVIGANLRAEVPLLAHRVRQAAVKAQAKVSFVNPRRFEYLFDVAEYLLAQNMTAELTALLRAATEAGGKTAKGQIGKANVTAQHKSIIASLMHGERRAIFLGQLAQRHPAYAQIRVLATMLAKLTGATLGLISEGANSAGAYLAGAIPHRGVAGTALGAPGLNTHSMLAANLRAYVLFGGMEPEMDIGANSAALSAAPFVLAISPYLPESVRKVAQVVLPIGSFAETAGTFVNLEGRWQSWTGATKPLGEARPGWKVLRVLGNLSGLPNFEYDSSDEVRAAVRASCAAVAETYGSGALSGELPTAAGATGVWCDVPIYQGDALVRRSRVLRKTRDGQAVVSVL